MLLQNRNSSSPPLWHTSNNPWYNSIPVCFWVCHVDKTARHQNVTYSCQHKVAKTHGTDTHTATMSLNRCQLSIPLHCHFHTNFNTDTQFTGHPDILLPLLIFWLLTANCINCRCNKATCKDNLKTHQKGLCFNHIFSLTETVHSYRLYKRKIKLSENLHNHIPYLNPNMYEKLMFPSPIWLAK